MNAIYDSELYHHGVKGQKWGVRHERERVGSRRRSSASGNGLKQPRELGKGSARKNPAAQSERSHEEIVARRKKIAKIAVVSALAVVGAYTLSNNYSVRGKVAHGKNLVANLKRQGVRVTPKNLRSEQNTFKRLKKAGRIDDFRSYNEFFGKKVGYKKY
jgi:glycogen debranching enzyme